MLNVNKITSMLAKMPDPQLQQYAQMHKNDPYIMALAMSESNRRKEVRAVKPPMAEQPKVVDQEIAQMIPQQLPEDQGIGQLPAGNMNFANGGIIAFADGGDVERYQFGGQTGSWVDRYFYDNITPAERERRERIQAEKSANRLPTPFEQERAANMAAAVAGSTYTPEAYNVTTPAPAFQDPRLLGATPASTTVKGPTTDEKTGQNLPASAAKLKPAAPGPKPAAPAEDKSASGLDALVNKFTRSTDLAIGDQRNARAGLVAQLEQEAKETKEEGEARRLARGDVFAKKEGRLAEREKDIAGLNDKYMGLALLQAGAAMMSTPGNLGSVIGKGIQVGSERYVAGIDKINAAKDKFAEARDRLDDLRINRDDMNEKEVRDENRAIRTARIQGQQLLLDGAGKDLEISNANQKAIFGVAAENILADKRIISAEKISKNEIAARERIAQIPQGQERIASLLGKGNLEVGLAKFAEIQAGKFNPTTAYTDYISKRKEGDTVLTPQEFVTQIRSIQALMAKAPPTTVDTSKPDRQ